MLISPSYQFLPCIFSVPSFLLVLNVLIRCLRICLWFCLFSCLCPSSSFWFLFQSYSFCVYTFHATHSCSCHKHVVCPCCRLEIHSFVANHLSQMECSFWSTLDKPTICLSSLDLRCTIRKARQSAVYLVLSCNYSSQRDDISCQFCKTDTKREACPLAKRNSLLCTMLSKAVPVPTAIINTELPSLQSALDR